MKSVAIAVVGGLSLLGSLSVLLPAVAATEPEILEQECHTQLQLGDRGCTCIRERAEDILNEKQQRMVVALVTQDLAASDALRPELTTEEMSGAANFMMSAPRDCANR